MKVATLGLFLTGLVAAVAWLAWGNDALLPSALFGMVATAIQVTATVVARLASMSPFPVFVQRWAVGIGLRLAGVALLALAVALRRDLFAPLPAALGFLGVLIPLLLVETRFVR